MKYILIPIIVVLVILVVVSLVKGIVAFMQSTKADLEHQGPGPSPNQLLQNKMMFNRIKYQALAVVVVAILLAVSK
jgi:flagellar basal body-associated protein FliL